MGIFDKFRKDSGKALCQLLHNHSDVTDPKRKAIAQQVIDRGHDLNDPLAWLACGFAFSYLGADYRKSAILQFEKYLSAPLKNDDFSLWSVYNTLAELYEAELNFESAEQFYILRDQEFQRSPQTKAYDPLPNVSLGRLYLKMSVARAVEYWQEITKSRDYRKYPSFKRIVDRELADAQAKQAKGYVYKPRGRK